MISKEAQILHSCKLEMAIMHLLYFGALLSECWAAQVPPAQVSCSFPPTNRSVCGSDGNTYLNIQELECLAMKRSKMGLEEMFLRHEGPCTTTSRLSKRTSYGRLTSSWRWGSSNGVTPVTVAGATPLMPPLLLLYLLWRHL